MEPIKYTSGELRALRPDVQESRTVEFVISSNTKDRHGSVLPVDKWSLDRFNANGIVGYQHNVYGGDLCNAPDPDDVIGIGRAWVEGDLLIGSVQFETADINPKADKIFRKVINGTLKATSVGFAPTAPTIYGTGDQARGAENETEYYQGQELLEFSIVNIPSNPDALRRSLRDQAGNAIAYIYRQLGGAFRFADIESMSVRQVMDLLEKKPEERGITISVEVNVNSPDDDEDEETEITPEIGDVDSETRQSSSHSDQMIDRMNAERERDGDLILLTRSKLALQGSIINN